jgi:hypothetical protein
VLDLLILGLTRASEIAGPPEVTTLSIPPTLLSRFLFLARVVVGAFPGGGARVSACRLRGARIHCLPALVPVLSVPPAFTLLSPLAICCLVKRCSDLSHSRQVPNDFLTFKDQKTETKHPIRLCVPSLLCLSWSVCFAAWCLAFVPLLLHPFRPQPYPRILFLCLRTGLSPVNDLVSLPCIAQVLPLRGAVLRRVPLHGGGGQGPRES